MAERKEGARAAEVYGFVGMITTVIAYCMFLAWAYVPDDVLRSMGITYYPSKYWAVAIPAFVPVAIAYGVLVYTCINMIHTPDRAAYCTLHDSFSIPTKHDEGGPAGAIPPISDISIMDVNRALYDPVS
eukprot:jgi/Mesvir1/11802/Mv00161-RA.1